MKKHSWRFSPNKIQAICRDCGCVTRAVRYDRAFRTFYDLRGKTTQTAPPCDMAFPTGIDHLILERNKHFKADRTVEQDAEINTRHQLTYAAMMLLHIDYDRSQAENFDIHEYAQRYYPPNWDEEQWLKMLNEPYFERVKIAGSLLAGELDRIMYTGDQTTPGYVKLPAIDTDDDTALGDLIGSIWSNKTGDYSFKSASITLLKEPSDEWKKVYADEGFKFVLTMAGKWKLEKI